MHRDVFAIILGGGKGTRLFPLTEQRSKPAVQFGGKYRLVDIPISNCINSGLRKIFVLTQFNSASLNFHVNSTYNFDSYSGGFVNILAAEQTPDHDEWYNGTADAVRKNFYHFQAYAKNEKYCLILSGDQLYRMDFKDFYHQHIKTEAEMSIAAIPVNRTDAAELGIVQINEQGFIESFMEKPGRTADITAMKIPESFRKANNIAPDKEYLASMGIYFFNRDTLEHCLNNEKKDFGKEIIPDAIGKLKVNTYLYTGYWEDIGTIKSFYEANLDLASIKPNFNMYDAVYPVYTNRLDLPPSKLNSCNLSHSLATEGSIITEAFIRNSIIGTRTIISEGANLDSVICMGADFYENVKEQEINAEKHIPNIGIGAGSIICKAIIDKNVRIGKNCRIGIDKKTRRDGDYGEYMIIDNIIVIRKNAIIPDGTSI
jgi:glucose-1-phosphate adenylyltransferase